MSDEGIDQEEANFYHDERRQRLAHEGNRMSNIEPTEEQKQAASTHIDKWQWWDSFNQSEALARLLAEREAKLRAELSEANAEVNALRKSMMQADACIENFIANEDKADELLKRAGLDDTVNVVPRLAALVDETVALRARVEELEDDVEAAKTLMRLAQKHGEAATARVAELESRVSENIRLRVAAEERGRFLQRLANEARTRMDESEKRVAELEAVAEEVSDMRAQLDLADTREAQHLADIKALMAKLVDTQRAIRGGLDVYAEDFDEVLARLAHYDDAKTAEGGEG